MNIGERAELKLIASLGCMYGKTVNLKSGPITIQSIQIPVSTALHTINPINASPSTISAMTDDQLQDFCRSHNIQKAGAMSKADVFINSIGYSVKSTEGAPPAIVNHTNRLGWEFAAQQKGLPIRALDQLINDYWSKRLSGVIKEDVGNDNPNSPFSAHIQTLLPFLEYFSFEGSGSKISNHPAKSVIEFSDPCNEATCDIINKPTFISSVWNRLVFSLRSSKGMPSDINALDQTAKTSVLQWSRDMNGKLKGALHVRVK